MDTRRFVKAVRCLHAHNSHLNEEGPPERDAERGDGGASVRFLGITRLELLHPEAYVTLRGRGKKARSRRVMKAAKS